MACNIWAQENGPSQTPPLQPKSPPAPRQPLPAKKPEKPLTEEQLQKMHAKKGKPPTGASFYMAPITERPGNFTILISDEYGQYTTDQVALREMPVLEAIFQAALKFAASDESVGQTKPLITRFSDDQVPRYLVDVSKKGNQSQLILTLQSLQGKLVMDAGTIKRNATENQTLFAEILQILQRVNAGDTTPQTTNKYVNGVQVENGNQPIKN
ncbi:MAG: hypothetical protein AB1757_00110 [Acidobacteriota bacterium]